MVAGSELASTWCMVTPGEGLLWGGGGWGLDGKALPNWVCRAATV